MDFLKQQPRISFLYNGESFANFNAKKSIIEDNDTLKVEYLLEDGLRITNIAKKYSKYDTYEWVTWFENTSDKPSEIISDLYDCDCVLPFDEEKPLKLTAFLPDSKTSAKIYSPTGSQCCINEFHCNIDSQNYIFPEQKKEYRNLGGRSSDQKAPFFNINRMNKGVIFAIGWSGQWNCEIARTQTDINIKTKIEDTNFRLLPGEKIRTSSFVMMTYDCGFTESQNKWRRLIKEHFSIIGMSSRQNYGPFCAGIWGGMSTEGVLDRVKTISDNNMPFEYIWMDAGWYGNDTKPSPDDYEGDWYLYTGDWNINKHIHPDNMQKIVSALKACNKKFLLWFEPERVINTTPTAGKHPEYFIDSPFENDKNLLLNLGNEDAWQYCFKMLCEKIKELNISCYRQDFNFEPLEYWRKNDASDRKGITEIKHIMGLYRLWDALLKEFPHLIIDNCASGGRRIDIELLKRSIPLWRSDAQCPANFPPEITQTHSMCFPLWMPYSGTGSGREWGDEYRIRSAYSPALTTNYTFSERDSFGTDKKQLDWIKKYSEEYLHVRPYLSADFYPLTEAISGNDTWVAWQYNRPENSDGIVQIFKRENSSFVEACFNLWKINADKKYIFTDADDNKSFEITGYELIENGFTVKIQEKRKAKIYFYTEK